MTGDAEGERPSGATASGAGRQGRVYPSGARRQGKVYLVGAGPGEKGLMTARSLELIAQADVILYDKLIPADALEGARPGAELIFVGKEGGGPSVPQEETESLLVEKARQAGTVVRLKGGDPFVFGRGGEEALRLVQEGIDFEVVPGITAGVAAPAYAGIPVTHRNVARAVAFVTGETEDGGPRRWEALAAFPGTLVFYMGVRRIRDIAQALIAAGRDPHQPAAVVERGTMPGQRTVTGQLSSIAEVVEEQGVKAPAITVIGEVAALARQLSWRAPAPLSGVSVAVTRARPQVSGLASRLRALGAEVVEAPAIRIEPSDAQVPDLSGYDLLCLTSPNGVEIMFDKLSETGRDARALAGMSIAAIGPGTARALGQHGIAPDVVPSRYVAEGLVEALRDVRASRALIARASKARDVLPDALRARGMEVDVLSLYDTVAERLSPQTLKAAQGCDYITFTSSSTVSFFSDCARSTESGLKAALPPRSSTRVISIGPVTSETIRQVGLEVDVEAQRHDIDGLIEALLADVARR